MLAELEGLLQCFSPDNFLLQFPVRGGHYVQAVLGRLRDFARGDVHHDGATFLPVEQTLGFDVHEPERPALADKFKITGLFFLAGKNLFEKSAERRTKPGGNQLPKRLAEQTGTFNADQRCPGQIGLKDGTRCGEGKISARREIVEVGVILQRHLQFIPGLPQLGVLHLQFNLMDLQFMEQPPGIRSGLHHASFQFLLLPQLGFGPTAQLGGLG